MKYNWDNIQNLKGVSLNKVRLIHGGKEFFETVLDQIRISQKSIHLQTYIFEEDQTGLEITAALIEAAHRGFQVHLLADGYASQKISAEFIQRLENHKIHFRFFEPLFKSSRYYLGRRLHHKLFVADNSIAIIGGINISNRYNDVGNQKGWLDFAVCITGEIPGELCTLCWKTWYNFNHFSINDSCKEPYNVKMQIQGNSVPVRVRRNDWVRRKNQISISYMNMLRYAESHILIICSYFLPGKFIRTLLKKASKRGVKITIITAGPTDILLAKYAERWMYDWLLRNNIQLYEYQPVVLHAKVAVCDSKWTTMGSYNINNISAYASVELNVDIFDDQFTTTLENEIKNIIKQDCVSITSNLLKSNRNLVTQFLQWCAYEFIRIMFYLMTFYFKQKK